METVTPSVVDPTSLPLRDHAVVQYSPRMPFAAAAAFHADPPGYLRRMALRYGDVVRIKMGPVDTFLLNDPGLIHAVLVTHDALFSKSEGLRPAERLLGKGLLTSEGEFHRRQRRLAQPAFHRKRIEGYARVMATYASAWPQRWKEGVELDMAAEMRGLTLQIAAKTLFDTEVVEEIDNITAALTESLRLYRVAILPFAAKLERFVPFLTRRFDRARSCLDRTVYHIIAERRAMCVDRGDLLSMLMLAQDEENSGGGMTDEQLRDEAITLLLAGYETTANALAWTWWLLSQHPQVEERLHAELDEALAERVFQLADLSSLPYTRAILSESMRLYPPAWIVARAAVEDCPLQGFVIPAGSVVFMSQWVTHHDPKHYPDPFRFDPDRWAPEAAGQRPRFAYYPFGAGSRTCIGEQFAWTEATIILATLARQWRFRSSSRKPVVPAASLTLRPRGRVPLLATARLRTP